MTKYRVIKVEDAKESLTNAIKEMHDALMTGGGIGFDLRELSKKEQEYAQKEMDQAYHQAIINSRAVNRVI